MIDNFSYFFRRNSVTIAVIVIVISLLAISIMQAISYDKLSRGAEQRTKQYHQLLEEFQHQSNQMDCIAAFFNQTDRQNKSISDIHKCQIETNSGKSYIYVAPHETSSDASQSSTASQSSSTQDPASKKQSNSTSSKPVSKPTTKPTTQPKPQPTILEEIVNPITDLIGGI